MVPECACRPRLCMRSIRRITKAIRRRSQSEVTMYSAVTQVAIGAKVTRRYSQSAVPPMSGGVLHSYRFVLWSQSMRVVTECACDHRVCMRSASVHAVPACACSPLGALCAGLNLKAQDRVCNTRNTPAPLVEPSLERPPRSTHTPTLLSLQPFTTFNLSLPQSHQP